MSFNQRSRARIVIANLSLFAFEEIAREQRNSYLIFLLLQWRKVGANFDRLVGLQQRVSWLERDLILVFLRHSPIVFYSNPGVVLHLECLLRLHTHISGWEEELFLLEADRWGIAKALNLHLLHVHRGVVEDELRHEVVEPWRLRVKFDHNNLERLA